MMPLIGCGKVSGRTPIHLGCVYCIVDSLFWKRLIKSLFLLSLTSFYSGLKSIPARVLRFVCIALVIRKSRTVRWRKTNLKLEYWIRSWVRGYLAGSDLQKITTPFADEAHHIFLHRQDFFAFVCAATTWTGTIYGGYRILLPYVKTRGVKKMVQSSNNLIMIAFRSIVPVCVIICIGTRSNGAAWADEWQKRTWCSY